MSLVSPMRIVSLVGLISLVGLVGCSSDDDALQPKPQGVPQQLTLITSTTPFFDVQRMETRALPTGYVSYNALYPQTTPPNTTIGVFMTPERADAYVDFIYKGYENGVPSNKWTSTVNITDGTQYYMYGFMPQEDAKNVTITDLNDRAYDQSPDWSGGAKMSLRMNTVTAADVCLIVGVKKYENASPGTPAPPIEDSGIQLGQFGYQGGPQGTNFVYLLLKHIYSALHFKMSLDADYASLRTIKVTNMELKANATAPNTISETIDLQVTLTANDAGTDPVTSITYTPTSGSTPATATIFPWSGGPTDFEVPTYPAFSDHIGCFAPNSCKNFTLTTTFDVYDKQDNLTRKGAVAENVISIESATLNAGEVFTVNLTVKPTYLYVLSDPDLENPTVTLNN